MKSVVDLRALQDAFVLLYSQVVVSVRVYSQPSRYWYPT
jgi:hypothetical protein